MDNFNFYLNTRIDFGRGRAKKLYEYIKEYECKDIVIIIDKVLIDIGMLDLFTVQLGSLGVSYRVFDEIRPNPEVHNIDDGAEFVKKGKCDLIIAIGGGSTIDTAKGISVMALNEGSVYDYLDGRLEKKAQILINPIPVIAIPTTAGTGSEVSMYAVITDEKTRIKDSLTSINIYPNVAIIDSELTMKLPSKMTAYTGLDVLGHALEAYTSSINNPITDIWALEAIKLTLKYLPEAVNENTEEARDKMSLACVIAGSAMSHCGATIPHGLGCPLSGHLNLPHGLTVGLLQIPMIKYNKTVLKKKFYNVVKNIEPSLEITEEEAPEILIELIRELLNKIGVKEHLDKNMISEATLSAIVEDANIHGCTSLNVVPLNKKNIEQIYSELFQL